MLNIVLKDFKDTDKLEKAINNLGIQKDVFVGFNSNDVQELNKASLDSFVDYLLIDRKVKLLDCNKIVVTYQDLDKVFNIMNYNLSLDNSDLVFNVVKDFFDSNDLPKFTNLDFKNQLEVDNGEIKVNNKFKYTIKEVSKNPELLLNYFSKPKNITDGFGKYLNVPWIAMSKKYTDKDVEDFRRSVFNYILGITEYNYRNYDKNLISFLQSKNFIPLDSVRRRVL